MPGVRSKPKQDRLTLAALKDKLPPLYHRLYTEELLKEVQDWIDKGNATGERVTYLARVSARLTTAGLASKQRIKPSKVAIDPENRERHGASGAKAQVHGDEVVRAGYASHKEDAQGQEPLPDMKDLLAANAEFASFSGGLIPDLDVPVEIQAWGATHTNIFLHQVAKGAPCIITDRKSPLYSESGHLEKARICLDRPELEDAVENGMLWTKYHWSVRSAWPSLPSFAQRALNTVAKGDITELETMLLMQASAAAQAQKGQDINWDAVEEEAKAAIPACKAYIPEVRAYVESQFVTDSASSTIKDLDLFSKTILSNEVQKLGGDYLGAVAKLSIASGFGADDIAWLKNAALKAQLVGPKIVDGFCRTHDKKLLNKLTEKGSHEKVREAEKLLTEARKASSKLSPSDAARLLGQLDVRAFLFLVDKPQLDGNEFESMNQIAVAPIH